nr:hypothetical protein [Candidatus Gracilibacteria bacterium]
MKQVNKQTENQVNEYLLKQAGVAAAITTLYSIVSILEVNGVNTNIQGNELNLAELLAIGFLSSNAILSVEAVTNKVADILERNNL